MNDAEWTDALLLPGMDGSNPLAFLATVGLFRVVTDGVPGARLGWQRRAHWTPSLLGLGSKEDLLDLLERRLNQYPPADDPALTLTFAGQVADKLTGAIDSYRSFAREAAHRARPGDRRAADFALAWRTDGAEAREYEGTRKARTELDFTAGNQKLLSMVRNVASTIARDELERTLFQFWDYPDGGKSLRWDPLDETRQYAVQFHDPSKSRNPIRTMTGANRLAVEALPWLPVFPTSRGTQTAGFETVDHEIFFTWPIWTVPAGPGTIRSILASPELRSEQLDYARLRRRGIEQVFRSKIVQPSGRYRCFAPARRASPVPSDKT